MHPYDSLVNWPIFATAYLVMIDTEQYLSWAKFLKFALAVISLFTLKAWRLLQLFMIQKVSTLLLPLFNVFILNFVLIAYDILNIDIHGFMPLFLIVTHPHNLITALQLDVTVPLALPQLVQFLAWTWFLIRSEDCEELLSLWSEHWN